MRTHILHFVWVALELLTLDDLEIVVPFASTLNVCFAFFVTPMLWMFILFFICSAVGGSIPFSVRRLMSGFRATAIPLNLFSPPSGVACLNCTLGLMQVSSCNKKSILVCQYKFNTYITYLLRFYIIVGYNMLNEKEMFSY